MEQYRKLTIQAVLRVYHNILESQIYFPALCRVRPSGLATAQYGKCVTTMESSERKE